MADEVPGLRSLSPEYRDDEHGEYVRILMAELQRQGQNVARNIALTGHYGSGKSSVLVEVQRQLTDSDVQVINLSLPSLGIGDARLDTPSEKKLLDTTNLIQKEIVKQLLYRRKPSDTPASRYNRLDVFQVDQARRRAAGTAAGFTILALLSRVPQKVKDSFPDAFWATFQHHHVGWLATTLQWLSLAIVFALAYGAAVWSQRLFHQRLRLTELAAGPAKVTLSENSTSFFDEYLDEIVYFFQNSRTTVVVYEDLDRFEDPHIFETLRELNLLLNNAEQTGDKPIRFVYAIRDSIFEKLDEDNDGAQQIAGLPAETRRKMATNRTKFFDLVVPVVPFISHRTSRELIRAELATVEEEQRPGLEITDLVSVHLTDMRLIKNICNEYDVFRPRILGAKGLDGLTPDRLFASIVYKNVYMGDYEKIRNAESLLDELYAAYRDWVAQRAARARAAESDARAQLNRFSTFSIRSRSQQLGERLQAVLAARGPWTANPNQSLVIVAGKQYPWSSLVSADFWKAYLAEPEDLSVIYRPPYGVEGGALSFDAVQTLVGRQLSSADWSANDRSALRTQMTAATAEQRRVAQASLTDALRATDSPFDFEGRHVSLEQAARELFEGAEMARELLGAGYIDENYTLYVTQFSDLGSASAMNFILKAVQPDVMDIEYHFGTGEHIDEVLQAEGPRLLHGHSVYNVQIFDRLLGRDPAELDDPMRRLARNADSDDEFISAYLSAGKEKARFVERLAARWGGIFGYLIERDPEASELDLLSAAIRGADPESQGYELAAGQREALVARLPRLTADISLWGAQVAKSVALLLENLDVRASDVSKIAQPLRDEMVARNLYEITRSNLITILGDGQLSLDTIKANGHDEVYQYQLDHLAQYLAAILDEQQVATVADPGHFADVLADVERADPESLAAVASGASEGCLLDNLSGLESTNWHSIARAHRLRLTVPLVTQYVTELAIDNDLAGYLAAAQAFEITEDEPGRLELGLRVLNDRTVDDTTKMALLGSLRLVRGSIAASSIETHAHGLIPRLVSGGWIADDSDAFNCLEQDDRSTKQALALASAAFPEYMTSLSLTANDLLDLASASMPDAIKEVLLREYTTFEGTLAKSGAKALATWIADKGQQPDPAVLVSLANKGNGAAAAPIIRLLGAQATAIDLNSLLAALNALGEPYSQLTNPGWDRPSVSKHPGMEAVLLRLQGENIVSRVRDNAKKARYEVSKRHS